MIDNRDHMIDNQDRRTLRRLRQAARERERKARIKHHTAPAHDDDIAERKRIEKAWKQSIDFFENTGGDKGDPDGKA